MSEEKLRPKYHKRLNRDGTKSVALKPESYAKLKAKADELDCTIKSLLAVLIDRFLDQVEDPNERIGS